MKEKLYHQALLDLAKRGRSQPRLERPDVSATVDNPICGDRVTIDLMMNGRFVKQVGHKTRGCLLCQAAAAIITDQAPGHDVAALTEKARMISPFLKDEAADLGEIWSDCRAFAPVHAFKSRHDCVALPFQALIKTLESVN